MCGIYGYLSINDGPIDVTLHQTAVWTLTHRGPDESGTYYSNRLFLGMRRLSIIDLAGGTQPVWNESHSICIVFNGELYNYRDLKPILQSKGHYFTTDSDTEVIVHAYEEWGVDCLQQFNGMFAFAIWDENAQRLFIARDRIGEKPLYYFWDQARFAFASEIKAIVANRNIPRNINYHGLANYLAFGHAVAPDTIYENIFKLLPGHYLVCENNTLVTKQYWDISLITSAEDNSLCEEEWAKSILELLNDSVRRRMIADVPIGAFLSGGVDSSAITALMAKHTNERVKTFSLGFSVGGAYNELSEAKQFATTLGTDHYELMVDSLDLVNTFKTLVYHYDEPFGDAAGFPVYLLSKFAREHVKVVLAGDGGDELFGGYRRYAVDQFAGVYQRLPGFLTRDVVPSVASSLPRFRRVKQAARTLSITNPPERYAHWLWCFTPDLQEKLLQAKIFEQVQHYDPSWVYPKYYNAYPDATDHLNKLMYVDMKTWLPDGYMEKTDKASMAASLEARLPFLDHRLVELAFRIPSKNKVKHLSTKCILKKAVSGLIPDEILSRPKHGFAVPTDPWFRGDLKEFAFEVLLDDSTRRNHYFNLGFVESMWREHERGRHVWDTHLWLLLNFVFWQRVYLYNS